MILKNGFFISVLGLLIPFVGTSLGAATVFILRKRISDKTNGIVCGFASGVMIAALFWSLLLPSLEKSASYGKFAFFPPAFGFLLGIITLELSEKIVNKLGKNVSMLFLSVTVHNIPEGMAVGVVMAGAISGEIMTAEAIMLSVGIAIQNFPEGAVISLPLKANGKPSGKCFLFGVLSGAVEPVFGGIAVLFTLFISPILPFVLSFAAGAMIYAVSNELIIEANKSGFAGINGMAFGFLIMMILDTVT